MIDMNVFELESIAQIIEEEKSHWKTGNKAHILEHLEKERIYKRS